MMLDRLLLLEDIQTGFTFYYKLNATDKFILSDYFNQSYPEEGLKWALIYGLGFFVIAAILFLLSAAGLKRDIEEARAYSEGIGD